MKVFFTIFYALLDRLFLSIFDETNDIALEIVIVID